MLWFIFIVEIWVSTLRTLRYSCIGWNISRPEKQQKNPTHDCESTCSQFKIVRHSACAIRNHATLAVASWVLWAEQFARNRVPRNITSNNRKFKSETLKMAKKHPPKVNCSMQISSSIPPTSTSHFILLSLVAFLSKSLVFYQIDCGCLIPNHCPPRGYRPERPIFDVKHTRTCSFPPVWY